ncbi:Germ cell-less protein-like 1 [Bienertia sinuspersici]
MKMSLSTSQPQQQQSDNDQSSVELRALDCNLASLCDHIQSEGFNNGVFSDIVVRAMDSTYHLHRLILSRSSYFRNMLHGPWKEASAPVLNLQIDDKNVNSEAIAISLAYLYGNYPNLNDNNAFRVLAAASFLDLQELCAICTDFIITELWTSNFLAYQLFAENQDYGIHGERVRNACWGYLCQSGFMELKEVLPQLSSQTLHALLTSNELWIPSEEKRFELALYTLLKKSALSKAETEEKQGTSLETGVANQRHLSEIKGKNIIDACYTRKLVADMGHVHQVACSEPNLGAAYSSNIEQPSLVTCYSDSDRSRASSYIKMPVNFVANGQGSDGALVEGPSEESRCCQFSNCNWLSGNDSRECSSSSINSSCNELMPDEWGRNDFAFPWGGRTVGQRQVKGYGKGNCGLRGEEYDTFINIFEGGSVLYCNMSFEALLDVRKQLEELGFPCKAVNDGLWLQMLLSQRVQEIAAETCKNCCLLGMACACKQSYAFSHGSATTGYYIQAPDQHNPHGNIGDLYVAGPANGEGHGVFKPVRVHVRASNEGLAGIGRGATLVPASSWCPTRFVFSRVPFGVGNRNGQPSLANDDVEHRPDQQGEMFGDGLTALVGLTDGGRNVVNVHGGQTERTYELDLRNGFIGTSAAGPSGSGIQVGESANQDIDSQWENTSNASISLDMKTPLSHFPPFRFGVEFEDVHRLNDGQVKHSPEAFYAGSFWKISVQAFNDEDPQGRRTLGLFIHRRKAEIMVPQRKVHMYVDTREKVTARYQLICPSKREVMVFGSFKQAGTLLPKAPKGWGWRSAILFDELPDLLQNGSFRVSAVVQLV